MRVALALALGLALLVAAPVHAGRAPRSVPTTPAPPPAPAGQELEEARRHFRDLEYEAALAAARAAAAATDAKKAERAQARALAGSALVVLGRKDEAIAEYEALFALDPDFELPEDTSPRILLVFKPARARFQVEQEQKLAMALGPGLASLKLNLRVPDRPRGGSPIEVGVDLVDPKALVDSVVLAYRREGERLYSTITAQPSGPPTEHRRELALTIPGAVTASRTDYLLELHVAARHRSGSILRRFGDAEHPLTSRVRGGRIRDGKWVASQWWLWTSILAIAGGAVAAGVLLSRDVGPQTIVFTQRAP